MSATRREDRVGWCPSVSTPMEAHDGLLVRIKPAAATMPAAAVRALADAAIRHGNGDIDLTSRANLQIRGLRPDATHAFAAIVHACSLASADGAFEEIRNVAADPLGADDPDAAFDSHAIARSIEAMLANDAALRTLPPKFGFLVDCGRTLPVCGDRADIFVRARGDRLTVMLDGGRHAAGCTPDGAPEVACRLAQAFLALAGPAGAPPYRMRELVAELGEFAVFARAGIGGAVLALTLDPGASGERVDHAESFSSTPSSPGDSPLGWLPFAGRDTGAMVAGATRGRLRAETLGALAGLAEEFADGTLRMTPWRALAFVPVALADTDRLAAALGDLDLIIDRADPRRALRGPEVPPAGARNLQKAPVP